MQPENLIKADSNETEFLNFSERMKSTYDETETLFLQDAFRLLSYGITDEEALRLARYALTSAIDVKNAKPIHPKSKVPRKPGRPKTDPASRFQERVTVYNQDITVEAIERAIKSGKTIEKERHLLCSELLNNYARPEAESTNS